MLFLTVLAAALGLGTLGAARSLDRQLAGRLTVQIVEADRARRATRRRRAIAGRAARRLPGVARAPQVDRARARRSCCARGWAMTAPIPICRCPR